MELFTYLMAKSDHNTSVNKDLFSYLLGKNQSGTYTDYSGTSLSINNTKKGKMKVNLLGNTSQTGTPTPSAPIPVNVVSGDNTIVSTGKNLANTKITNWSYLGVSVSYDETTQVLTINGTSTGNTQVSFQNYNFSPISVSNGERINLVVEYISGSATSTNNARITLSDINYTMSALISLNGIDTSKIEYKNISTNLTYDKLNFVYRTGDVYNNLKIKIMVCKGTDATYEPYTSTSYQVNLGDKELCKIGDYQDRFFKNIPNTTDYNSDLEDNAWYLEKKIGKYTFTGNEINMSLQNNGKRIYIGTKASSIPDALHTTSVSQTFGMYCNKLVEVTAGQTWGGTQGISYDYNSGENTGNFDISINGISTLEAYRTAIAGIILYYILQTPTYTQITGTLKDELEALQKAQSYKGTTNINQINNDLPFNMNVSIKVGN